MKNFIKEHASLSIISFLIVASAAAVALRDYVPVYVMVESAAVASGIFASSLVIYAIFQSFRVEQEQ